MKNTDLLKLITALISPDSSETKSETFIIEDNFSMIGNKVIIRTHMAGVFYGKLLEKSGNEIILADARRLYYWKTLDKGISLSEVAISGLHDDSKVCAAVDQIWLQPIEIIPCSAKSIKSIEGKNDYKA